MKRYNKTENEPDKKKIVKYKLKSGITWGMVELKGEITQEVIDKYFDTIGHEKHHTMGLLWEATKKLENITWKDVEENEENVLKLIETANNELLKLRQL